MIAADRALTNQFLRRTRLLLECCRQTTQADLRAALLGAAVAALDQAVCAWIAEIVASTPQQRTALVGGGHFPTALAELAAEPTAELQEMRQLREQPQSALFELAMARQSDLQPPPEASALPAGLQLISSSSSLEPEAVARWLEQIQELIDRGRQLNEEW